MRTHLDYLQDNMIKGQARWAELDQATYQQIGAPNWLRTVRERDAAWLAFLKDEAEYNRARVARRVIRHA